MIGLAVIFLLIVVNGFFVAMEFVIVGSRLSRLEAMSAAGGRIARILHGAEAQDRYVAVAQLGITLASIGLGMYGEHKMTHWLEAPLAALGIEGALVHVVALVAAVALITYFHVVFGEMIPKALALKGAEPLLLGTWPVIRFFELLFRPFVWLLNVISQSLLSLFGLDRTVARYHTPRELASIAEASSEGGAIEPEQAEFIRNIVRLQGRRADELMTPRRHVLSIDLDAAEEGADLGHAILDAGPSRLPVTRGGLDHVTGVVHVKDVIRYRAGTDAPLDAAALVRILRPLPKVLAGTDTATLLRSMRRHGTHMALVADEYGVVVGAVAFEDAIEEVVGEIHSEFEVDGLNAEGHCRRWKIPGTIPITRLSERFGWEFGETGARTLAGLFMERLRRMPETGDACEAAGIRFRVARMDGLAVTEIVAEDRSGARDAPGAAA